MAESKSNHFPLSIQVHSEKTAGIDIIIINNLAGVSEYDATLDRLKISKVFRPIPESAMAL
jgi:hypothetical protein